MRNVLAALLVTGCATAGPADQPVDAGSLPSSDSSPPADAAPDAPGMQTRTLSQTNSPTIKPGNTLACGIAAENWTRANNYYRVFDLAALGITTPFTVTKVTFDVERCDKLNGAGTCTTVAVRVGTYAAAPGATLTAANMTILASNATVPVNEVLQAGATVEAPISATISAGQRLLVEVDAPDGQNAFELYMGSNDAGETGLGYISAPDCGIATPTNLSGVVGTKPAGPRHLLLTVTGTY